MEEQKNNYFLCYNTEANMSYFGWENEAIPLGNGKIGAKVFGPAECELISFNEKTLWSGGPGAEGYTGGLKNADSGKALREVQDLLFARREKDAEAKMRALEGSSVGFGSYQAFGSLYLQFDDKNAADKYVRDLDLDSASAMVSYRFGNTAYTRHYFCSYPDNVFVGRIECVDKTPEVKEPPRGRKKQETKPKPVEPPPPPTFSFTAYFVSEQKGTPASSEDCITVEGEVHANAGLNAEDGEDKNGLRYAGAIRILTPDGKITANEDGSLRIEDATSVVLLATFATDYENRWPDYRDGSDPLRDKVLPCLNAASEKSFAQLYHDHLIDYRALYRTASLDLGEAETSHPTDFMLKRFDKNGEHKRFLITTLFQYGRYLLIASSRDGSLPANLQGIWNAKNDPPWNCDYHLNINLQMNYWPAFVTNLAPAAHPFCDFINSLRVPGRIVAKQTLGIGDEKADGTPDETKPTGWVANTMVNPFGCVAPGWSWRWGWAPVNGAWAAVQAFEEFRFTGDVDTLKNNIFPTLQESALLFSRLLREDKDSGRLVVAPCFSPEHGPVTAGGTYEQSIVFALFDAVIEAANALKAAGETDIVDEALLKTIQTQITRLSPYAVGKRGQIKEWYGEDRFHFGGKSLGVEKQHRHISHLLGLYPFNQITAATPGLMKAAKVSLDDRGIRTTGWALAHRLCCYARLGDGESCDLVIAQFLKTGVLKNMMGNHPPFQIDANFGFTAGVAEMLLQSHDGVIRVLPALPKSWHEGKFTGFCARGGFVVGAQWKNDRLKEATIQSERGGRCRLMYDGKIMLVLDDTGAEVEVDFEDGVTSFDAKPGVLYRFS